MKFERIHLDILCVKRKKEKDSLFWTQTIGVQTYMNFFHVNWRSYSAPVLDVLWLS